MLRPRPRPRPCEHHALLATATANVGRCLECGQMVPTPFAIHGPTKKSQESS